MNPLKQAILQHDPNFFRDLDPNLKFFAKEVRRLLREEEDCVIAFTGYPGKGKSNNTSVLGLLIDDNYSFEGNICFIPTSKEIEDRYLGLKMYSFFHIDEASRGLHKQKWYDKIQQTLNTLYDTEREGHFLCSVLIMPRFQNFTENFRNFRIIYWIHAIAKGVCIVFRKDEDKDCKDPWHLDESYKKKIKHWRDKSVFERSLNDVINMEKKTVNYWFYFKVPKIPEEVWKIYQDLKKQSRIDEKEKEESLEVDSYQERRDKEKMERWKKIKELKQQGYLNIDIATIIGCSSETIRRDLKGMESHERMKGRVKTKQYNTTNSVNNIFNLSRDSDKSALPVELDKI